jgi:beta-fructofuranosidase
MKYVPMLALCFLPLCARGELTNDALARATAAVQAATPRAQADPAHPVFHVTEPAQWINDPNGPIYYKGFYHLFYQLDPFSDTGGPRYWGHVRSRDLAKWEHLPIALWPSSEAGEAEVWSGCCTINGLGQPMIFYTSIALGKSPQTHAEQWAALGDDDLIHWRKSPANPVLSESLHGERKIYDWRDPFVFRLKKRTFLVTGGNLNQAKGGQAAVNIYEAQNAGLTQWKYRGVLFQIPDAAARTAECPNFFQLGDQWVLFVSPYGKVPYFVGDFDGETCRFHARTNGLLDFGPNFYAPNTMQVPDGRRLVWGWVNGFPGGRGWNGCLSLPRLLSLSRDGQLQQNPAPQLTKLRGKAIEYRNVLLDDSDYTERVAGMEVPLKHNDDLLGIGDMNTLEIQAEIDMPTAKKFEMQICEFEKSTNIVVRFNGTELQVMDVKAPLTLTGEHKLKLRIFLDRSVLEVFANETVCITKTIPPVAAVNILTLHAEGGSATAKLIQVWPMKTIW